MLDIKKLRINLNNKSIYFKNLSKRVKEKEKKKYKK